mmetsp:Transcript_37515/g.110879  ORF Transcript_37515/g.110879 Transcript_37515/m.110879 type:complete len:234 (-) Transcript_37515:435-1136(-)
MRHAAGSPDAPVIHTNVAPAAAAAAAGAGASNAGGSSHGDTIAAGSSTAAVASAAVRDVASIEAGSNFAQRNRCRVVGAAFAQSKHCSVVSTSFGRANRCLVVYTSFGRANHCLVVSTSFGQVNRCLVVGTSLRRVNRCLASRHSSVRAASSSVCGLAVAARFATGAGTTHVRHLHGPCAGTASRRQTGRTMWRALRDRCSAGRGVMAGCHMMAPRCLSGTGERLRAAVGAAA